MNDNHDSAIIAILSVVIIMFGAWFIVALMIE